MAFFIPVGSEPPAQPEMPQALQAKTPNLLADATWNGPKQPS
jgi:hypothetical protein